MGLVNFNNRYGMLEHDEMKEKQVLLPFPYFGEEI